MPRLVVGGIPRGADFFDREKIIEELWDKLEHNNVLLQAPRRFGKTGVMFALIDNPKQDFKPIYIDTEDLFGAENFMIEILANLLQDHTFRKVLYNLWDESKEIGRFIRDWPSGVDIGGVKVELREKTDIRSNWRTYGERIMELLSSGDGKPLLIIDEFPIMLSNIHRRNQEEAEQLLRWFRAARLAPNTKTRFLIGGSINLVSTLTAMGLVDTINDLYPMVLRPFDLKTGNNFIEAACASKGVELPDDVRHGIMDLIGQPVPFLLATFVDAIFGRIGATSGPVTMDMINSVFSEELLGGRTAVAFNHYRYRISQYYSREEQPPAQSILGLLSRADDPVRSDTVYHHFLKITNLPANDATEDAFKLLMTRLENDFYIVHENDRYLFFSRVLKLWWKSHYGFQLE